MEKKIKATKVEDVVIKDPKVVEETEKSKVVEETEKTKVEEEKPKPRRRRRTGKRPRKIKDEIFHCYIPKHELLTEEDIEELIEEGVNLEQLPNIYINDPGICHIEVKPGDIIRIRRINPIVGESLYYRIVVSAD